MIRLRALSAFGISLAGVLLATPAAADPINLVVHPPVSRVILPLEQAASSEEILNGVDACRAALSETGKFDARVFDGLHWRQGGSYPADKTGAIRTEYYNGNLVNDILIAGRVDGCFTKAKVSGNDQFAEVRQKLMEKYDLEPLHGQPAYAGYEQAMVRQFGDKIRDLTLVGNEFLLVMEPTIVSNTKALPAGISQGTFLSITYVRPSGATN